jgi:hypothetical protein
LRSLHFVRVLRGREQPPLVLRLVVLLAAEDAAALRADFAQTLADVVRVLSANCRRLMPGAFIARAPAAALLEEAPEGAAALAEAAALAAAGVHDGAALQAEGATTLCELEVRATDGVLALLSFPEAAQEAGAALAAAAGAGDSAERERWEVVDRAVVTVSVRHKASARERTLAALRGNRATLDGFVAAPPLAHAGAPAPARAASKSTVSAAPAPAPARDIGDLDAFLQQRPRATAVPAKAKAKAKPRASRTNFREI